MMRGKEKALRKAGILRKLSFYRLNSSECFPNLTYKGDFGFSVFVNRLKNQNFRRPKSAQMNGNVKEIV